MNRIRQAQIVWGDSPTGNTVHIARNGLTPEEVESVLRNPDNKRARSRSAKNRPIVFGFTNTGRFIAVVFEDLGGNPRVIYPITAFEIDDGIG